MAKYIVNAQRHRVVRKTTENGETVRVSTIYGKGDTIEMSPDQAERLVRTGGLIPADQVGEDGVTPGSRLPDSAVPPVTTGDRVESPAALSGQTAEEGLREATKPSPEALAAHAAALEAQAAARAAHAEAQGGSEGGGEDVPDDGYGDLEYPELQALAKERGLEHTGKKTAIVERLRAFDADEGQKEDGGSQQ